MLVLLPPSETKRAGGDGKPLDIDEWALPSLGPQRRSVIDALVALSADEDEAARVLKLSARRRHDVVANAALLSAPTLPAIDRYTGVLFDALDAGSLSETQRTWLGAHVLVHSAPFGPIGALDRIPVYRLAAGTSVPGLSSLRRVWADPVTRALSTLPVRFVLDLRSEAYAALGPVPSTVDTAYVRVMTPGDGGVMRALNHFNKHAKGDLVRSLASAGTSLETRADFLAWAAEAGWDVRDGEADEISLVV